MIGSHCRSELQQRLFVAEPQLREVGQQAPLTQVFPVGLQRTGTEGKGADDAGHVASGTREPVQDVAGEKGTKQIIHSGFVQHTIAGKLRRNIVSGS